MTSTAIRHVSLISLKHHGITFASALKAARALVLSKLARTPDVTFGHLVSGRNVPFPGIDQVVGPCISIIPVRVALAAGSTFLDLLHQVQEQQIASSAHETLGWATIARRCTDWALAARVSSVVQHQNLDEVVECLDFGLGGPACRVEMVAPRHDAADVWVVSTPGGEVRIEMGYCPSVVEEEMAEGMMDKLCRFLEVFARDVHGAVEGFDC